LLGVRNVLLEAAKNPSPVHIDGITALLCHVMRGTYTRLHSRAGKIMEFLLSKSNLTTIQEKFPDG
jgi:U3 small nucleolar RNA-associated protein 20